MLKLCCWIDVPEMWEQTLLVTRPQNCGHNWMVVRVLELQVSLQDTECGIEGCIHSAEDLRTEGSTYPERLLSSFYHTSHCQVYTL